MKMRYNWAIWLTKDSWTQEGLTTAPASTYKLKCQLWVLLTEAAVQRSFNRWGSSAGPGSIFSTCSAPDTACRALFIVLGEYVLERPNFWCYVSFRHMFRSKAPNFSFRSDDMLTTYLFGFVWVEYLSRDASWRLCRISSVSETEWGVWIHSPKQEIEQKNRGSALRIPPFA